METEVVTIVVVLLVVTAFATIGVWKPEAVQHHTSKQLLVPRELLVPRDENEMIMIRSLLESEGIPYQIHNDNFGTLYPGPGNFALLPLMLCREQVGDDQLGIRDRVGRKRRAVPLRDLCAESLGRLTDG